MINSIIQEMNVRFYLSYDIEIILKSDFAFVMDIISQQYYMYITCKLEDLKVLRRSPDLLNNVKIGQGQLQLIMEQILFYHIWGLLTFWSSDLNNLMTIHQTAQ